jgi:hypothetical protein
VGSKSFVESFVAKVFHENLGIISSLLMFANHRAIFVMLSLCYAQCHGYLFHIMFPFSSILQHYAEFNIHTIAMLEKLLGVGTFGGFINHLTHH